MVARFALARHGLVALCARVLRNGGGKTAGALFEYNVIAPRFAKRGNGTFVDRFCRNTAKKLDGLL